LEDEKDEKEARLRRMEARRTRWLNNMMVKELLLEVVGNASKNALINHVKSTVLEDVLSEAVMRSEMKRVLQSLESVEGMESRVFRELVEREERRKKQARIARRMEKEAGWLTRRNEEDMLKKKAEQYPSDPMEWEEHDLEYRMASLGLEADDLFMMEDGGYDGSDWLDAWMGSLSAEGCSDMIMHDEDAMEIVNLGEQDRDMEFMTWLVKELKEMCVAD
jgi:hypothetical protein